MEATGDFIGTQLNKDSEATSQPGRGSSIMANREITVSQESQGAHEEMAEKEIEEDNEDEDDDEEDEDYQDDDYEEDNYEDDDQDFESDSQIEKKSDNQILALPKEEESPELKLAKDNSQVETRKVLQISGMLSKEDPASASKVS